MADYYFHYTSRVAGQMITAAGALKPNKAGIVYLTDELCSTGAQAADLLGIPVVGPAISTPSEVVQLTKPVEVVCCIPFVRLDDPSNLQGPDEADQFRDYGTGEVIYLGGGTQFKYPGAIDIRGLSWIALGSP